MAENSNNQYDINGQYFNPDNYLHKLLKVCHLYFVNLNFSNSIIFITKFIYFTGVYIKTDYGS